MSFVTAATDLLSAAAADVAQIGSTVTAAHAAAAVPTTEILAAAEDEVSTAIAGLFSSHARDFQALAVEAADFHVRFVQTLLASAGGYAGAEAANSAVLGGFGGHAFGRFAALSNELLQELPTPAEVLAQVGPVAAVLEAHSDEIVMQAIGVSARMSPIANVGFAVSDGTMAANAWAAGRPLAALAGGVSVIGDVVGIVNPSTGVVIYTAGLVAGDAGTWFGVAGF